MGKDKKQFVCNECGAFNLQWSGQCVSCKSWNTIEEEIISKDHYNSAIYDYDDSPQVLTKVSEKTHNRISTGLSELDNTLGGGLVIGSVVLVGGDPGIGKSTLILQSLANISKSKTTLYVSGEESVAQISNRAKRLNIKEDIFLVNQTNLAKIIAIIEKIKPETVVIDSIQTIVSDNILSASGSVTQVRECAAVLTQYAKKTNTILLMIGHVTKDGAIAGPRILEHMVDCVLYFEGDAGGRYRIIRAVKNRFGTVQEISIFAMSNKGLLQVDNPSAIFLAKGQKPAPGSMVMVYREATRPILIEIQALVSNSSGQSRKVCVGIEQNRLALLLAILHKHCDIKTYDKDVFINVVGGIKITETASDLAILLAIVSSLSNKIIPKNWVSFGEVGLTGEVRPVYNGEDRLYEAKKHGFKLAIIPKANAPKKAINGLKILTISYLHQALSYMDKNL